MLNEQNIEEKIFEYHEGLLDPQGKAELMEYLHHHPEWQREFAIWAQARLHDEPVNAPKFQKKLLKNIKKPWWYQNGFIGIGSIITLAGLVWILYPEKQQDNKFNGPVNKQTEIKPEVAETKVQQEDKVSEEKVTANVKNHKSIPEGSEPVNIVSDISDTDSLNTIQPQSSVTDTIIKDTVPAVHTISKAVQKPDSVQKEKTEIAVKSEKKKKKQKVKISLKPTSDIIPSNPNF